MCWHVHTSPDAAGSLNVVSFCITSWRIVMTSRVFEVPVNTFKHFSSIRILWCYLMLSFLIAEQATTSPYSQSSRTANTECSPSNHPVYAWLRVQFPGTILFYLLDNNTLARQLRAMFQKTSSTIAFISQYFCPYDCISYAHTGVILSSVLHNAAGRSPFLLVLDGRTFKEIARVEFEGVDIHKDLHGLFAPFSGPRTD